MPKPLLKGVLKTWKEDRGFGFISPEHGGRDLFIHISALVDAPRRPQPGDVVHYQITRDRQGKLRAINAHIEGMAPTGSSKVSGNGAASRGWLKTSIAAVILLAVAIGIYVLKTQNLL